MPDNSHGLRSGVWKISTLLQFNFGRNASHHKGSVCRPCALWCVGVGGGPGYTACAHHSSGQADRVPNSAPNGSQRWSGIQDCNLWRGRGQPPVPMARVSASTGPARQQQVPPPVRRRAHCTKLCPDGGTLPDTVRPCLSWWEKLDESEPGMHALCTIPRAGLLSQNVVFSNSSFEFISVLGI